MTFLLRLYKIILNIVYSFLKLFPTKKRILFLSRQSNNPSIDYQLMIDDIKKRYSYYDIKVLTKRMVKTNIKDIICYIFHPFKQLFYLATSSICVVDGYQISVSVVKHKKNIRIIQIWHSLGAIKKFGYQSLKTPKEIKEARIMDMHNNYDAIICSSASTLPYYEEAFNYQENKFFICPLPRVDYLLDSLLNNKKKVYHLYPNLKDKKVILYVPTFRKSNNYKIDEVIKIFNDDTYELIIKKHPRMNIAVDDKYKLVSSTELLGIADYIITDYSAISIEASIIDKPILFYVYDYDEYQELEGINIDLYEEFKPYVFKNIKSLYKCIKDNNYNLEVVKQFKNKYIENYKGKATKRLVDYVVNEKN